MQTVSEGSSIRRRSLFDNEDQQKSLVLSQSDVSVLSQYPPEYVQKVEDEIKQWQDYITTKLDYAEKQHRWDIKQLKKRVFNDSLLTPEQLDFLGSVSFDHYISEGKKFLEWVNILQQNHESKKCLTLEKLNVVQKKIAEEIFKDVIPQS